MAILPALIQLVFPPSGGAGSFNADREWDRIARELDQADQQTPSPAQQTFRLDYIPPVASGESSHLDRERMLPIYIPRDKAQMAEVIQNEVESLYVLYGTPGLDNLIPSLELSTSWKLTDLASDNPPPHDREPEKFASSQEIVELQRMIWIEIEQQIAQLQKRTNELVRQIEKRAVVVADRLLEQAGVQLLTEATRYLKMDRRSTVQAQRLLETTELLSPVLLVGPDVPALLGAIRKIQDKQLDLDIQLGMAERSGGQNALNTPVIEDAIGRLAETKLVQCREFPILNKTGPDISIPSDVQVDLFSHPEPGLMARTAAGGTAIKKLKEGIFTTLQKGWISRIDLARQIQEDHSVVWRFPPLVQSTLEIMAEDDPSFSLLSVAAQAAQERLAEEKDTEELITTLTMITGFLDIAAMIGGAAPPVGLTLAAISFVLSATSSTIEFFRLRTENRAYNAALDPDKALSSEQGYGWFVFGVLCTLLDVKGIRDAVRASRFAREAAEVGRLAEVSKAVLE